MGGICTQAAILAGGLATRLGSLAEGIPKSLIDVAGEPFIARQLQLLKVNGVESAVICAGHLGDQLQNRLGNKACGLKLDYSFDGPRALGTAGALKKALPLFKKRPFFCVYGDSYLDCDYQAVSDAFDRSGKRGLMTVFRNDGKWDTSNVEFDGVNILAYNKKKRNKQMRYIDYGLGIFKEEAFGEVPENSPYDLEMLYRDLLSRNELAAFEVKERFYEIGSPSGLEETRSYLEEKLQKKEKLR